MLVSHLFWALWALIQVIMTLYLYQPCPLNHMIVIDNVSINRPRCLRQILIIWVISSCDTMNSKGGRKKLVHWHDLTSQDKRVGSFYFSLLCIASTLHMDSQANILVFFFLSHLKEKLKNEYMRIIERQDGFLSSICCSSQSQCISSITTLLSFA